MYLYYQNNYRGMLATKQIKKLDDEYLSWMTDTSNRFGDNAIYEKLRKESGFSVSSIFFDTVNSEEFIVEFNLGWANKENSIRLKSRGKSDHSGIYDVVKYGCGWEHWNTMI